MQKPFVGRRIPEMHVGNPHFANMVVHHDRLVTFADKKILYYTRISLLSEFWPSELTV